MLKPFESIGRIGVLMGGYSSEREISLKSGKAIVSALKDSGFQVDAIDLAMTNENRIEEYLLRQKMDVAFIALHGALGEDGRIQTILERLNIPYTGSGILANRLTINKAVAQMMLSNNGINVPPHFICKKDIPVKVEDILADCGSFPLVVKPACGGSSIGVQVVGDENELINAIENVLEMGEYGLVEKFIKGRELTVGILDQKPLEVIEVCPKSNFFDYKAKYERGMSEYVIPAQIDSKIKSDLHQTALKVHNLFGCCDFSRIDFILDPSMKGYVLEINTIPGFTETSLLPKAAKSAGINFIQLCTNLVELAYGKKKKEEGFIAQH